MTTPLEKQIRIPTPAWKLANRAAMAMTKQKNRKVYLNAMVVDAITEYISNHPELGVK